MRINTFNDALNLVRIAKELPDRLPIGAPERIKAIAQDYLNVPYHHMTAQDKVHFVIDLRTVAVC